MRRLLALIAVVALAFLAVGVTSPHFADARTIAGPQPPRVQQVTAGGFIGTLEGDWSPEAKASFEMAAQALSDQIKPKVPVTVLVILTPLDPNLLGLGGGSKAYRDFPGAPIDNTWYPVSLANQLVGQRIEDAPDATVRLNSIMPWNYDGDPKKSLAQGKPDFVTTVMHEILHGMGLTGSVSITEGVAEWGDDDGALDSENHLHAMYWNGGLTPTSTPLNTSLFFCAAPPAEYVRTPAKPRTTNAGDEPPTIYDRFIVNGTGDSVLDTDKFPDPSPELNDFLTSDDLYWNGPAAMAANKGKPVKIYAPTTWRQGSSYAHVDDPTYDGTEEALMTAAGAKINDLKLGPRLLGILQDMGWSVGGR